MKNRTRSRSATRNFKSASGAAQKVNQPYPRGKGEVRGKELFWGTQELQKSRDAYRVKDVQHDPAADGCVNVWAVTAVGKIQIGMICPSFCWIGSRDVVPQPNGTWGRPFHSVERTKDFSEEFAEFTQQWEDTQIYVAPHLPPEADAGDVFMLGGDAVIIDAWLEQSRVMLSFAQQMVGSDWEEGKPVSKRALVTRNIGYMLAGQSVELLFKALVWVQTGKFDRGGGDGHRVFPLYNRFNDRMKAFVDQVVVRHGWASGDEFVEYLDRSLLHTQRRYLGVDKRGEFVQLKIEPVHSLNRLMPVHAALDEHIAVTLDQGP